MSANKTLGVLGGLGPMATVYFYELVTTLTNAKTDQQHVNMLISSFCQTPDRSAFILGKSSESPAPVMQENAKKLVDIGAGVIAIPCNTAHFFHAEIQKTVNVKVLNMPKDTVAKAKKLGTKKLGVLATKGTLASEIYQKECRMQNLPCAVPNACNQQLIMNIIYNDIKAGLPPDMQNFNKAANELFDAGCEIIVLGCTELSLIKRMGFLDDRFVDSMEVLAAKAILACGKTLKTQQEV